MNLEDFGEDLNEELESFETLLNESFKSSESGNKLITGVIVGIDDSDVLIDIGTKSEGRISVEEIKDKDGNILFNVGDEIKVLRTGGMGERPSISYKKALKKAKKEEFIEKNKETLEDLEINGVIIKSNKGGYIVESDDIEFFLPRSLAAFRENDKPEKKDVTARVVKFDPDTGSIIISRRAILNEKRKERRELLESAVQKGDYIGFSEFYEVKSAKELSDLFSDMEERKLEGLIVKDPNAPYSSSRDSSWCKLKVFTTWDVVVLNGYLALNLFIVNSKCNHSLPVSLVSKR